MKIFVLGHGLNLVNGLTKLGHSVIPSSFYHTHHDNYKQKLLIRKLTETKPDVVLFSKYRHIKINLLKRMKLLVPNAAFIMWYGDQRGHIPAEISDRIRLLDLLLITNTDPLQFNMYHRGGIKRIETLHLGFHPESFYPINKSPSYQIFFGGSNFGNRFPLSKARYKLITTLFKNYKMLVYGNHWPFKSHKIVPGKAHNKALNDARLNIGANHYHVQQYYDRRIFECVPTGKLHLTVYIPGMEKDFENHKHLVWFKTIPECMQLVDHYLKNPKRCYEIGRLGRDLFLKNHTYEVRAKQLVDIIKSNFGIV